jgi:hypothetical protein
MRKACLLFIAFVLYIPAFAHPSIHEKKSKQKISVNPIAESKAVKSNNFNITGYADGSYSRLLRNRFTSGAYDRAFDVIPNGLTLHQAAVTFSYQPEGFGYLLNLIAGQDAQFLAPYGFQPITEFDSQTIAVDFTQAYIQYLRTSVTFMLGRYLSTNGNESLNPTLDTNFSRSILYSMTPYTFTGVRTLYSFSDKLNVIAGVNNGPDTIRDWSRRKTIELGVNYTPSSIFSFSAIGYNGQERAVAATDYGPLGTRTLIDLVGTVNVTEKLSFVANYDYAWQTTAMLPGGFLGKAVWKGIAGYVNYKFTEKWMTSLRGEVFDDSNGYRTGVRQNWREVTLTLGYAPIKDLQIHLETRRDFSNVRSFTNLNAINTSNNNQSYAIEAFYKFG